MTTSKTEIALQWCHDNKTESPGRHAFWVDARSTDRFYEGYIEIARKVELPDWNNPDVDPLALVRDWFNGDTSGDWLLVVDSADSSDVLFKPSKHPTWRKGVTVKPLDDYIPQSAKGKFLITSRDSRIGRNMMGNEKPLKVPMMSEKEAIQLFRVTVKDVV